MSVEAEEALQRAKAIAAKLSGQQQQPIVATTASTAILPPVAAVEAASTAAEAAAATTSTATTSTAKRKRWGVMPEVVLATKKAVPAITPTTNSSSPDKATETEDEQTTKRIWIRPPSDEDGGPKKKPPAHYVAYLSRHFKEVHQAVHDELGVAVESKEKKQKTSDDSEEEKSVVSSSILTIQLDGRGATNKPAIPGMPQQPLHILIEGKKDAAKSAAHKLELVLLDAHEAPLEEGVSEFDDSDSSPDKKMNNTLALVAPRTKSVTSYQPASVAQMIAGSTQPDLSGGGGGPLIEDTMGVPHGVIGYIIGRGGETIASLQMKTGCKVQIQKETDLQPGQTLRELTLIAHAQEAIEDCKRQIEKMVQERVRMMGGGGNNSQSGGGSGGGGTSGIDSKIQEAVAAGHTHIIVEVPEDDVGLVIGKQGSTIRSIQEQTGANVQVPPASASSPSAPSSSDGDGGPKKRMRVVHITHLTEEGAQAAKQKVEDILKTRASFRNQGPNVTIQVHIPDKDIGLCIGRSGCVIRHMQSTTHCRIQIPSQPTPGETHRIATISGPQEGCDKVRQMIQQIVTEQSSQSVMSGAPHSGGNQQQRQGHPHHHQQQQRQQQQQSHYGGTQDNQQAYSAEWAAYHAAVAAQQQQQQQQQPVATPAPAPAAATAAPAAGSAGQQPAADTYHEQFFRYAYYYGEEAARKYYGAWSPPVGTANPYGVNPAGIQPAPAPAPGAAPTQPSAPAAAPQPAPAAPAPAPAAPASNFRETGRRKVSNLPAWMTNKS